MSRLSKDDLDVSKIKVIYSDYFVNNNDSTIVHKGDEDVIIRMHSATGSRNTYMLKITYFDIFPFESYLIVDQAPHSWIMLDFHILWFFGGFPPKML
jgi:hypothetical protein